VAALLSGKARVALPVDVHIERVGPRKLDSDNLEISAKHVRDEIAKWLGIDDGDESKCRWKVSQSNGPYEVRVSIVSRTGRL
jgi:endonuclease III